jgi:hypothetical protein
MDVGNRALSVTVLFSGSSSDKRAIQQLYPDAVLDIVSVDFDPKRKLKTRTWEFPE